MKKADEKLAKEMKRRTDKSDRATVENVLDRRTLTVRLHCQFLTSMFDHSQYCSDQGSACSLHVNCLSLKLCFELLQILHKMLNRDIFQEIYGCISTGKEANVYHAVSSTGKDYAVKIFKTSILQFKDRDR